MSDPTSSKSGKGTRGLPAPTLGLTDSGSQIRAAQRDCSTTAPLLRPVATPAASLARVETEAGKETNELGFAGKRPLDGFVHAESRA
jgi:hypothetical protein